MTKKMNVEQMSERLARLSRGIAIDVGSRDDLDTTAKCWETGARILELFDGMTPDFPKSALIPSPHQDDKAFAQSEDSAWYEPGIAATPGYSELFRARIESGDWKDEPRECRAYTPDEARDAVLRSVASSCYWWSRDSRATGDVDVCEGAAFTTLSSLDGTSLNLPAIDILPDAADIEARPEVSEFSPVLISQELHGVFHRMEPITPSPREDAGPEGPGA